MIFFPCLLTCTVIQAHPKGVSEADLQALVKRQDLPEWVGNVLSTNCKSSHASAAVAPTPADAGEAVTSRERPLLAETSDAAVEIAGVDIGDSVTVLGNQAQVCITVLCHCCAFLSYAADQVFPHSVISDNYNVGFYFPAVRGAMLEF